MGYDSASRFQYWKEAGNWLLWTIALGLTPIWLSLGLLFFGGQLSQWGALFSKGQLALYAASMAGTCLYLCSLDRDPPGMRFRGTLIIVSLLVMLLSTLLYAAVETLGMIGVATEKLATKPIVVTSCLVYGFGTLAAFVATLVDNERLDRRFQGIQEGHEDRLKRDFEGLA